MPHLIVRISRLSLAIIFSLLLGGCVGSISGQLLPAAATSAEAVYYVERQEKDSRNLHVEIAQRLQARGFNTSSGETAERPDTASYIVTYIDRWMWDMRMYLSDLRIDVRDAKDNSIVAYGQSTQSSLKAMGKTHATVIEAALGELTGK